MASFNTMRGSMIFTKWLCRAFMRIKDYSNSDKNHGSEELAIVT